MRTAVIGAGVAGLTAAYRLSQAGHVCDVYERWPGLGGMAATIDVGQGHRLERYYHHMFTSDVIIAGLWKELGMADEVHWLDSSMACFTEGRLYPFTTPLDLMRFSAVPLHTRIRMGAVVVALQRFSRDPAPFERVTARKWVTRWMGKAAWDGLWGPMLRGKFGDRADEIAMVWLWNKWMLRRQVGGEEARGEKLGYPRGSWETLLEGLRDQIESAGGRVLIDRPAAELGLADGRFQVVPGAPDSFRTGLDPHGYPRLEQETEQYDAVVATVGGDLFVELCTPELRERLGRDYLERCEQIENRGALCLLMELDRRFSAFYWTNVFDPRCPFIGVIEHSNFAPADWYDGRHFVYVANYLENDDPLMAMSMDEVIDAYDEGLRLIQPQWSRDWIKQSWLFREPHGQPVVTLGYRERLPDLRTPVRGLVLANIQQVYPEDRGTNYAVRIGDEAARTVLAGS